jgi:hypothetical protein
LNAFDIRVVAHREWTTAMKTEICADTRVKSVFADFPVRLSPPMIGDTPTIDAVRAAAAAVPETHPGCVRVFGSAARLFSPAQWADIVAALRCDARVVSTTVGNVVIAVPASKVNLADGVMVGPALFCIDFLG